MCECGDHIAKGDKMSEKVEIVYKGAVPGGLKVMTDGETVWLTQAQICALLGRERSVITKHINNALREGEITVKSNVQNLHIPILASAKTTSRRSPTAS